MSCNVQTGVPSMPDKLSPFYFKGAIKFYLTFLIYKELQAG